MIHPLVAQHIPEIQALCREFGVSKLEIFGSAVTDEFDPLDSEVDFLLTCPKIDGARPWLGKITTMEIQLSAILGREVNLVMSSALNNEWFRTHFRESRATIFEHPPTYSYAL